MMRVLFPVCVVLLGVLTVVGLLVGDGDLLLALVPVLLAATLCAVAWLPLRYAMLPVTFLALTLENPADAPAAGLWKSALYPVGTLLLTHLNLTFPAQKWMAFSGLDIVFVYLFVVALVRWVGRPRAGRTDAVAGARPMWLFAAVTLGGAAWMWAWGMARGDADVASSLWQVQRVVYLPVVYFLFEIALRGRQDRVALGKVVIAAACLKAGLAIYLHAILTPPPGATTLDYVTTHADSMLFASAFCLVIALLLERLTRKRALLGAIVLPLLLEGMVANHRRIVWVEVAAGLALLMVMTPWTPLKRTVARAVVLALPVVLLYVAVGWGTSGGGVFAPVETIRSVVDSNADASTEWRDLENYDLFFTLRDGPILGSGYGHGYIETIKLPAISQAYALYRFIPHNSILGLWAYGGLVGFTALWSMLVVGLFLAARASMHAKTPSDRTHAIVACAAIVVYLVHCYGDMGLGTWTSVFLVGPAFAVASRLAAATGAWPTEAREARSRERAPRIVITVQPAAEPGRAGAVS